jgi:aspartate aminotransferase-like enzyme
MPDPRVLQAMAMPLIFTRIMDEVMELARCVFLTRNARCFPVSGLASAGLEAVINTLLHPGDRIALQGSTEFVAETAAMARGYGIQVQAEIEPGVRALITEHTGESLTELATSCHQLGYWLIVEATSTLGGRELRVDDWGIDAAVAGIDACLVGHLLNLPLPVSGRGLIQG